MEGGGDDRGSAVPCGDGAGVPAGSGDEVHPAQISNPAASTRQINEVLRGLMDPGSVRDMLKVFLDGVPRHVRKIFKAITIVRIFQQQVRKARC